MTILQRHFFLPLMLMALSLQVINMDVISDFHDSLDLFVTSTVFSSAESCQDIHVQVLRLNYPEEEIADYFCTEGIYQVLDRMNSRTDTLDFELMAFSWMLNRFWDHPILSSGNNANLKSDIVQALINLPFWLSDDGDLGPMQFWSENHIIGWRAGQYLIGHGFAINPELQDLVFGPSEMTGAQLRDAGREGVLAWLDYIARFGFGEFHSDTYSEHAYHHMIPLCVLAPDEDIRVKAQSVQVLLEFDQLLASRGNRMATARGRAYSEGKINDQHYSHLDLMKGQGQVTIGEKPTMYLAQNVLHGYILPTALLEIGREVEIGTHIMRERFGLDTLDGALEGVGTDPEECVFWLGIGAYLPPDQPECLFVVGDAYNLYNRSAFWEILVSPFKPLWDSDPSTIDQLGQALSPVGSGFLLGYANVYTVRTEDFMLSSAQDYNIGTTAGQQHVWQATLNIHENGTVFSHQPFTNTPSDAHNSLYWISGILPRVAQFGTSLVSLHNPEVLTTLLLPFNMTHAHLYTETYDEVINDITRLGGWIFARDLESFVGLYTHNFAEFRQEDLPDRDLVAPGIQNVWICEVGSQSMNFSFEAFVQTLSDSQIEVSFSYNDSLIECLLDNQCLESVPIFLLCMSTICSPENHQDSESMACLENSSPTSLNVPEHLLSLSGVLEESSLHDLMTLHDNPSSVFECLQEKRAQIEVSYTRGDGRVLTFNWDGDLVIDGHVVPLSDYPRYDNAFANVAWGDRQMALRSTNYFVDIDFESGTLNYN